MKRRVAPFRSGSSRAGRGGRKNARGGRASRGLGWQRWLQTLIFGVLITAGAGLAVLWMWAHRPATGAARSQVWAVGSEAGSKNGHSNWTTRLARAGWVDSDWRLALYTRLRRPGWSPAPGEHWLVGPISPEALLAVLARTGARPSQRVVVPEGYNRFQVAERLESQGVCPAQSFLAATTERRLLMPLGVHADSAEGYLFPATYELFVNSPPENVLATLVNETFRRFPAVTDELRATGPTRKLGWGMHEILTLASMVEKESGQESERPLIASVFFNRLQSDTFRPLRMLQSDPTAGYGCLLKSQLDSCSNYDGQVSARMLRDSGNRYNTYRHAGLPPGPIANPGAAAVRAVLKPSKSDYLFFVASSGRGHRFSRTLEQHREATRRR